MGLLEQSGRPDPLHQHQIIIAPTMSRDEADKPLLPEPDKKPPVKQEAFFIKHRPERLLNIRPVRQTSRRPSLPSPANSFFSWGSLSPLRAHTIALSDPQFLSAERSALTIQPFSSARKRITRATPFPIKKSTRPTTDNATDMKFSYPKSQRPQQKKRVPRPSSFYATM